MLQSMGSQRAGHDLVTEQQLLPVRDISKNRICGQRGHHGPLYSNPFVSQPKSKQSKCLKVTKLEHKSNQSRSSNSSLSYNESNNFLAFLLPVKASMIAQLVKNPPAMQEIPDPWVRKIPWRRDRLPTPVFLGFLCGSVIKECTCNAGDLGLIPGRGHGNPL